MECHRCNALPIHVLMTKYPPLKWRVSNINLDIRGMVHVFVIDPSRMNSVSENKTNLREKFRMCHILVPHLHHQRQFVREDTQMWRGKFCWHSLEGCPHCSPWSWLRAIIHYMFNNILMHVSMVWQSIQFDVNIAVIIQYLWAVLCRHICLHLMNRIYNNIIINLSSCKTYVMVTDLCV